MSTIREIITEHYEWRSQIFKLAKADIIKTYSGSALGWAWAIIKPTLTILVFWFAFSVGLRQGGEIEGCPYALWLIVGLVPWFFMNELIVSGARSIRKYKYLVTKMKFPVSTIPTFVALSKMTVHLCLMVIVILVFALNRRLPGIYLLQLPFYMLCMLFFFTAWSLFSAMLSSISKDFLNLVKSVTTALFWLSGILWDVKEIKYEWIQTILLFNPITYVSSGYRNVFIYKTWFFEEPMSLLCYCICLAVMVALGIWSYKKLIREIPDVL